MVARKPPPPDHDFFNKGGSHHYWHRPSPTTYICDVRKPPLRPTLDTPLSQQSHIICTTHAYAHACGYLIPCVRCLRGCVRSSVRACMHVAYVHVCTFSAYLSIEPAMSLEPLKIFEMRTSSRLVRSGNSWPVKLM